MFTEQIYIGLTTKTSKVVDTIEFEEDDLIREGLGSKLANNKLDLYRQHYYIGEWQVDLWGRDTAGSLISECSFGGYAEAEWEGEVSLDILKFWKLTKVEQKIRRGRMYYVIYSGKRHWDIDEKLYQREEDFLPVLFSLATDQATDVEFESDGVYYIVNDFKTVAVVRSDNEDLYYKGCLEIPATVTFRKKTYTVTEIRDVMDCEELTEVKLPDTIKLIAKRAFFRSHNIQTINFPEGLEKICEEAFYGCTSLEKVILPKNCWIDKWAFAWCEGLKEIVLNEQHYYEKETFMHCKSLETIILPATTKRLDGAVFKGCSKLKNVVLNEGLESFMGDCFCGCAMQELKIPQSVSAIYTPIYCESLMTIQVDTDNKDYCSVDGVVYSKDMKNLVQVPACRQGEFIIPDGVTSIDNHAFSYCHGITKVVIPDSVEIIGWESFYFCDNMESVIIGNGVTRIRENAFAYCQKLSTIVFGNALNEIEERAFANCTSLTKVNLPESIKTYNVTLFYDCENLSELTMPEWMEKRRSDIMGYASGKKFRSLF